MYIVSSFSIMNDKLFLTFFMIFVANCNFTCPRSYVCTWGVLKCTLQVHQLAEEKTSRSFQAEIIVARGSEFKTLTYFCFLTHIYTITLRIGAISLVESHDLIGREPSQFST